MNLQWLAVVATILIGALVVVALMSSRLVNGPAPAHKLPNAVGDYGPPPAGVPLVYLGNPNHPGWYIGFDWQGVPRGTIKLSPAADPNSYLQQSADGTMFVVTPAAKGGDGQYLDRMGQPITAASTYLPLQMWADDNRHYCTLEPNPSQSPGSPGPWVLSLRIPGSTSATSQVVPLDSQNLRSGIIAIGFGSCSAIHDRAVLVYNYFPRPPEVWIVRISDGKVLADRTYGSYTASDVQSSRDATLVAINTARSSGYIGAGPTEGRTLITKASDGSVVATLDPSYSVLGFSADDKVALVATSPYAASVATHLAAVELAGGNVIWRYDGTQELSGFMIEPAGTAFAVLLQSPNDQAAHSDVQLVIVYADGRSITLPGTYLHP